MSEEIKNIDLKQCAERLHSDFPALKIEEISLIGRGWDHIALEVNHSIIFRLPHGKYEVENSSQSVSYETAVLKYLQGKLSVEIPDPKYIAPNKAYFGYPKLPGVLCFDLLPMFTPEDKARLLEDWVSIAKSIHQEIPLTKAEELGVPFHNPSDSIVIAGKIMDMEGVDSEVKEFARRTLEFAHKSPSQISASFIHNDLHLINILADPETKKITGVIDWTACCRGPLEVEFSVCEWNHDESLGKTADLYEAKTGIKINLPQARMWRHLDEIADFVEHTQHGDTKEAEKSLNHITRWIAESNNG